METAINIEILCYVHYLDPASNENLVKMSKIGISDTGARGNYVIQDNPNGQTSSMGTPITA